MLNRLRELATGWIQWAARPGPGSPVTLQVPMVPDGQPQEVNRDRLASNAELVLKGQNSPIREIMQEHIGGDWESIRSKVSVHPSTENPENLPSFTISIGMTMPEDPAAFERLARRVAEETAKRLRWPEEAPEPPY